MNKKKLANIGLMILLFVVVAFGSYGAYAYLTQQEKIENGFTMDEVKGTITVTGAQTVDTVITNKDLAYIHYVNDFILNTKGLLDNMVSTIKIHINANNGFFTRIHISIPNLDTKSGLVYIFLEEDSTKAALDIDLKVEAGLLKYGYIENGVTNTWNTLVDMTTLSNASTNQEFRTVIQNMNYTKLKNIYTNELVNKNVQVDKYYRVLVWGDYESLSPQTKPNYLTLKYTLPINIKISQAIDQYGGRIDYDKD